MKFTKLLTVAGLLTLALASATIADIPDSLNPYVRKPRNAAVSLEVGANSLSSLLGVKGSIFITRQVAVDLGLGLSGVGLRPGIHARYLFSKAKFTPFVYGGFKYGLGSGGDYVKVDDPETDEEIGLKIDPSPYLDAGLGIDYLAHNGFYFNGGLGWSHLLGGKNYDYTDGASQEAEDLAKFIYGSGLALYLSFGYAF